jgi:hypothetical protein
VRDRAFDDYTARFRREVLPSLLSSAYMISVGQQVDLESIDLRAATELGLMLLLGKPLLVIVPVGETISDGLRRAAAIVLDDVDLDDPASQDRVAEAVRLLSERGPEQGER